MNEKQLLELKDKIDRARSEQSELKGKKSAIMDTLKKKFNCSTIKQAQKKLQDIKAEITVIEHKKEKGIKELQEVYEL